MTKAARLQLSLSDIARLADVRRPVVSMWRQRPLAGHAFPSPIGVVAGEERFDALEVTDYLSATGRGNNREAGDDLAAHAKLAQMTSLDETMAVDGLTALLCLTAMTDMALGDLSAGALRNLAAEADPEDTFLRREITALGTELEPLAAHSDALASASFSARAAFERILSQHSQLLPGHAAMTLTPAARSLFARAATALAADAGMETPLFVDVTDSSGDLLLATSSAYAAELAPSLATVAFDSPNARLARRRLRVHDQHRIDVSVDAAGDFSIDGRPAEGAVYVMQLPPAGSRGLSDVGVLDAVGDLIVQLADDSRVVVIGPASALTDGPVSADVDRARDAVLRSDRLRVAVRLPQGLLVRSPRRPLALWALGPAHPAVAVRDRWTVVADVSDRPLDDAVIDGLVTDVVAAMTPDDRSANVGLLPSEAVSDEPDQVRGHRFRFARRVPTTSLLPGRKALVGMAIEPEATDSFAVGTEVLAVMIDRLVGDLGSSPLAGLRVEAPPPLQERGPARIGVTTVGHGIAEGYLRVIAGKRLHAGHVATGREGRVVIGPAEVIGQSSVGARRIDPLTFAGEYPSGRFTEPGDVIFSTSPRIRAFVDSVGGSVVQSPARILRITQAGRSRFLLAAIARDVSATPEAAKDCRRWRVRVMAGATDVALTATMDTIRRERQALAARIATLDDLANALVNGIAGGTVTITRPPDSATATNTPATSTPQTPARETATKEGP